MKFLIPFLALILSVLAACADDTAATANLGVTTQIKATLPPSLQVRTGTLPFAPAVGGPYTIEGLYFGELEIVAYNYRPAAAVQNNPGFGNGTNWSYYVLVQSGHDAARDILLEQAGTIDFSALNGAYSRDTVSAEFVDSVGFFDMDVLEVVMHRNGVVYSNEYFGMNAEFNGATTHPLHRYPALATLPDYYANTVFPGFEGNQTQSLNVMFVRPDWFATPVTIRILQNGTNVPGIAYSSRALTTLEEERVLGLVHEGTWRRFYDHLVMIPMDAPVRWALAGTATNPSAGTLFTHPVITVSFDFAGSVAAETDFAQIRTNSSGWGETLYFNGDANHVPFGLVVTVTERAP